MGRDPMGVMSSPRNNKVSDYCKVTSTLRVYSRMTTRYYSIRPIKHLVHSTCPLLTGNSLSGAKLSLPESRLLECEIGSGAAAPAWATIYGAIAMWLLLVARPFPGKGEQQKNPKGKGKGKGKHYRERDIKQLMENK